MRCLHLSTLRRDMGIRITRAVSRTYTAVIYYFENVALFWHFKFSMLVLVVLILSSNSKMTPVSES
jgi:hypothetical protein